MWLCGKLTISSPFTSAINIFTMWPNKLRVLVITLIFSQKLDQILRIHYSADKFNHSPVPFDQFLEEGTPGI